MSKASAIPCLVARRQGERAGRRCAEALRTPRLQAFLHIIRSAAAGDGYSTGIYSIGSRKRCAVGAWSQTSAGGPGHVTRYLQEQGVTTLGIDLSEQMISVAQRLNPGIDFWGGDMTRLDLPDAALAGVVAFYSIVHFAPSELGAVMLELRRVLAAGGSALVSFHIGDEEIHVEDLFGAPVDLDFRFHAPTDVLDALRYAKLRVREHVEREPYEGAEYPSRRCYLLATAVWTIAGERASAFTGSP